MRPGRSVALARFALANNLRTPFTWSGLGLLVALALLGLYSSARRGDGWVVDQSLLFDGALVAAVFGLRSGLAAQRAGGLDTFLRANFMSPVEHMTGAILSVLGSWLLLGAAVFVIALALPGADAGDALWHAARLALRVGLLVPFVIMAESVSTIEVPFFLPALLYFLLLMVLVVTIGELRAVTLLAPPIRPDDIGTLVPSALRMAGTWTVGFGAVIAATALRTRHRRPRTK